MAVRPSCDHTAGPALALEERRAEGQDCRTTTMTGASAALRVLTTTVPGWKKFSADADGSETPQEMEDREETELTLGLATVRTALPQCGFLSSQQRRPSTQSRGSKSKGRSD